MMTCHPNVCIPPECGFVLWLHESYSKWDVTDSANKVRVSDFIDDLFDCRKFETWALEKNNVMKAISASKPETYSELCSTVYIHYGNVQGKITLVWGDKNNYYLKHIVDLFKLFEGARFLHIVRDGRDVACSYREVMQNPSQSPYMPVLPIDIGEIALDWQNNVQAIVSGLSHIPSDLQLSIRYEDLVRYPTKTLSATCEWLGIEYSPEMENFDYQNQRKKLEPTATLDWKRKTVRPVTSDNVGRYSQGLSKQQVLEFESIAGSELRIFGYKLLGDY